MPEERASTDISTRSIIKFFAILIAAVLVYQLRDLIFVLLFAIVIASAIEPAVKWLQSRRIPRILGTLIIFLSVLAILVLAFYLLVPLVTGDLQGFTLSYPIFERQVLREIQNVGNLPFVNFLQQNARGLLSEPSRYISSFSGGVVSFTSSFFGGIFSVIILIVVSFYLAARERGIEDFIRTVVPVRHEEYAVDLWLRSQRKMGQWFRAQLILGGLIGAFIYIGLTLLGIKYAIVFAFIAAILELVPIVGPILSALPAVLIAFLESPFLALMVILLYVVVQQLESHLIVPVVMKSTVGISPIVVVVSLLIGAQLAGIMGLLLAVPVASVVVELLEDFDKRKRGLRQS